MVLRMQNLEAPQPGAPAGERQGFANTFSRYVTVKEEHAEKCKEELRILWADYAWPNTDRKRNRRKVQRRAQVGRSVQADREHGKR